MVVGHIPESFIQEVLSRVNIVEIIQAAKVPIQKAGTNYMACCPFHHDKTPSFSVNQAKQFYHCFGCGVHGDAIDFLKEFSGLSFVEAIEQLAQSVGLEVPQEGGVIKKVDPTLYQLMFDVADFYHQNLKHHPASAAAVTYLKNRGLTGEIAKEYGLGFAPPGWDNVLSTFGQTEKDQEALQRVGLIIKNEHNQTWDRFRYRIMFPIRDPKGHVVGFGGRTLEETNSKGPKYLNSPETPLFHKSECLFGLYELLKKHPKISRIILVEGYMDVIALAQHNILGALATLGTAITEQHLKKLFHYSTNVVFCFDGDKAGRQAALKTLHSLLTLMQDGYDIKFVFLPEGSDPDSYIRQQGVAAFEGLLNRGLPLSEYFFGTILQQVEPCSIDTRAKFVNIAKPLLSKLPKSVFKEMMFHKLSDIVSVARNMVESEGRDTYERAYYNKQNYGGKLKKSTLVGVHSLSPAMLVALLLIRQPEFIGLLPDKIPFEHIEAEGISLLTATLNLLRQNAYLKSEQIEAELAAQDARWRNLPLTHPAIEFVPQEGRQQALLDAVQYLIAFASRQMSQHLLESSKNRELSDEEKTQLKKLLGSGKILKYGLIEKK